jgi:hypothetical protein
MKRPFRSYKIDQLEEAYSEAVDKDLEGLNTLRYELSYRSTARARELKREVASAIKEFKGNTESSREVKAVQGRGKESSIASKFFPGLVLPFRRRKTVRANKPTKIVKVEPEEYSVPQPKKEIFEPATANVFLNGLGLPERFHLVTVILNRYYPELKSTDDICEIDEEKFSKLRSVGKKRVELLRELKLYLNLYSGGDEIAAIISIKEPLTSRSVPSKYCALFQLLNRSYPSRSFKTLDDILDVDTDRIAKHRGLGAKKVKLLREWQREIQAANPSVRENPDFEIQLVNYRLAWFCLSRSELRLMSKLTRRGMNHKNITPQYLMTLNPDDIRVTKGFGRKSSDSLINIQQKMRAAFDSDDSEGILIPQKFGLNLSLKELCPHLITDLIRFVETLDEEETFIWTSRSGFQADALTLEQVGKRIGVTRERIRQRAKKLNELLLRGMRVSPAVLREKLYAEKQVDVVGHLSPFRSLFSGDEEMVRLLAVLADSDSDEIHEYVYPLVKNREMHSCFQEIPYPAPVEMILGELQQQLGLEDVAAQAYLLQLSTKGMLDVDDGKAIPRGMAKEAAVLHVLAGYPMGLGWRDVAKKVNEAGICRSALSYERPDYVLGASQRIYQCDIGGYRHVRFLDISEQEIADCLEDVRHFVEESKYEAVTLLTEYYNSKVSAPLDYFEVRHIVKTHGHRKGIHFIGRSRMDTVSLNADVSGVGRRDVLQRSRPHGSGLKVGKIHKTQKTAGGALDAIGDVDSIMDSIVEDKKNKDLNDLIAELSGE